MITPPRLYRYRNLTGYTSDNGLSIFDREIDALRNSYLYAASFESMNDPMEAFYRVGGENDLLVDELLGNEFNLLTNTQQILRRTINSLALVSFSSTYMDYPMWAYYAGNFSGMCLEFEVDRFSISDFKNEPLRRVNYSSIPLPPISFKEFSNGNIGEEMISRVVQKREEWAHEKEWRYLTGEVGRKYYIDNALVRIFLGPRISDSHRTSICNLMRNRGVEVIQLSIEGFELREESILYKNIECERVGKGDKYLESDLLAISDELKEFFGEFYEKFILAYNDLSVNINMESILDIHMSQFSNRPAAYIGIVYKLRNGSEKYEGRYYDSSANLLKIK